MTAPFNDNLSMIADSMGIALYQRFTTTEASLFLRCPITEVEKLQKKGTIDFIQVTEIQVEFFGYQLLEHLLSNTTNNRIPASSTTSNIPDRIIRAKEVQGMTGLSRTTLWRMEQKSEFPRRVSLGGNIVGWHLNEISQWINQR